MCFTSISAVAACVPANITADMCTLSKCTAGAPCTGVAAGLPCACQAPVLAMHAECRFSSCMLPAAAADTTVALKTCPARGLKLLPVQLYGQLGAMLLPHLYVLVPVQVFSLERSNVYIEEMVTRKFNVPFFVKSEHQFEQSYPSTSRER